MRVVFVSPALFFYFEKKKLEPWVDFTGWFLGHTPTVANPNPAECNSFFLDVSFFNFILSDAEMFAHMNRGKDQLLQYLPSKPLNARNAAYYLARNTKVFSSFRSWPLQENVREEIVQFWIDLSKPLPETPRSAPLNTSTFLYYPCLPRQDNVSLLPFRVQPIVDNAVRIDKCPPLVSEYSIAVHVWFNTSSGWTCLFRFDCSWGLWTDGTALQVRWNDSVVPTKDLMVQIDGGLMRRAEWMHIAARVWQESLDLYIDGKLAQRVLASPKIDHCGFVLGDGNLQAVFYLFSMYNHIISNFELDSHFLSPCPRAPRNIARLVAADSLQEAVDWKFRLMVLVRRSTCVFQFLFFHFLFL